MSVIATALKYMLAAGIPHEEIVAAVAEMEAAAAPSKTARQQRNARYYENTKRLKASENKTVKTNKTLSDVSDAPHVREPAQVVVSSLPSLRSEEVTPTEPNGSVAPKGAKTRGSKRVPPAWSPSQSTVAALEAEGHVSGDLERALTRMRDHEFRSPRTDWDAAFRNWVRTDNPPRKAPYERHRPDHRLDAFRDKLLDVATAMDAAFEQPRRQHGD
jgi:hypothetical protein